MILIDIETYIKGTLSRGAHARLNVKKLSHFFQSYKFKMAAVNTRETKAFRYYRICKRVLKVLQKNLSGRTGSEYI